ncbi:MAG: LysR family transcriptional regulator [Firmicutes bacterium]|nr:LysR family transcriptional regulator [Bacillota bacterium]
MSLNLYQMAYVVEVAKCGSISKAAQNLFLSQPHLSNTIKALEQELGVALFLRSSKGITLTEEGRMFVREAEKILESVEHLQQKIEVKPEEAVRSAISCTRSYQVNQCVSQFIRENSHKESFVLHVKETNPFQVVEDVCTRESELGILHIFDAQKEYFLNLFQTYGLHHRQEYEREFLVAVSENSSLACEPVLTSEMLQNYMVVIYGDYEMPRASYEAVSQVSDIIFSAKRVYVYDRASAMETLSSCPEAYMWITGLHRDTLKLYGLVLKRCKDVKVKNIGYSIRRSDAPLSWSTQALYDKMLQIDWTEELN